MGMDQFLKQFDVHLLYDGFDDTVTALDCGQQCAPYNPSGKPFCCDICHTVPVAYRPEWDYLQAHTDLWHEWQGDECCGEPVDMDGLKDQMAEYMILLSCKGPAHCQRDYRSTSCRQFPFFPYITADDRFLGLAYAWEFESTCWVISHLDTVTAAYRRSFIETYDILFSRSPDEFESFAGVSEEMRDVFALRRRRIPLLHRNGGDYLLSPKSERLMRIPARAFPRFAPYRD